MSPRRAVLASATLFAALALLTAPPAQAADITSVAITSTPKIDTDNDNTNDTYGRGEQIRVTVTWDADVTWSFSRQLAIMRVRVKVGASTKDALLVREGSATTGTARSLVFSYTVAAADEDTNGIEVTAPGGEFVDLGFGVTLTDAGDGTTADVDHAALGTQSGHKVNGALPLPVITISGGSAVTEGTAAAFTLTATPSPASSVDVNLTVSESANGDYVDSSDEGSDKTVTINSGAATATYSVTTQGDNVDEPNGSVTVQVTTGTGYTVGTTSSASVTVNDDDEPSTNNAPGGAVTIDGTATQNQTLTANTSTITDADGLPDTFSYQWKRGGTDISGETSSTYTLVQADVGQKISVTVSWTDDGDTDESLTSAATAAVTNVNDAPTVATEIPNQNATQGTAFSFQFAADAFNDVDSGDTLSYSAAQSDDSALPTWLVFTANTRTFAGTPANADVGTLSVKVTATDSSSATVSDTFDIVVANVNDAPVFTGQDATASVDENSTAGTSVVTVEATDPDTGDTVTYSLDATSDVAFDISSSGAITVAANDSLDHETTSSYTVTVTATDSATPALTATHAVTVSVTDLNEAPAFPSTAPSTLSIDENNGAQAAVGTVAAEDPDDGAAFATLTYSLDDTSVFEINSTTGAIAVTAADALNHETTSSYTVTVKVRDSKDGDGAADTADDATHEVTINVTDVNEAPSFPEAAPTTLSIAENSAAGTAVGTVAATDPDDSSEDFGTLTYSLDTTSDVAFDISSSGAITVAANDSLDHETTSSYTVTVTASDSATSALTATHEVTISVTDVNEAPSFPTTAPTELSVPEAISVSVTPQPATPTRDPTTVRADRGEVVTTVGTVAATDPDASGEAFGTLSYALDTASAAAFSIDSSGVIKVKDVALLDHEDTAKNSYTATVTATDGATPTALSATREVTITVSNVLERPEEPVNVVMSDATTTSALMTFRPPSETYGLAVTNYDVRYQAGTISVLGAFDPGSGAWTVVSDVGTGTLVAGSDPQRFTVRVTGLTPDTGYRFGLRAKTSDGAGFWYTPTHGSTNHVVKTLEATGVAVPAFPDTAPTALTVAENSAAGTAVGTVAATDADGDALTYTLAPASPFDIDTSGNITVESGATLNYEGTQSYSVTVSVTDGKDADGNDESGTPTTDATHTVTISVTNVEEPPWAPTSVTTSGATSSSLSVSWTAPSSTGAKAIANHDLRYYAGTSDPASETQWTEVADVGSTSPTTLTGLDASTAYRVQVRAKGDGAGPWSASGGGTTSAAVAGKPFFPASAPSTLEVAENSAAGTAVGTVAATDSDSDPLTYTLAPASPFDIDTSGNITVESGATLNYEGTSSYAVTVSVTDRKDDSGNDETGSGTTDATHTVTISVTNVEEPPGAPTSVATSGATSNSLSVSWTAPSSTGAKAIANHDFRYFAGTSDPASGTQWTEVADVGSTSPATLAGLSASTAYRVQVRAKGDGAGPWSASGSGTTSAAVAGAPGLSTATGDAPYIFRTNLVLTFSEYLKTPLNISSSAFEVKVNGKSVSLGTPDHLDTGSTSQIDLGLANNAEVAGGDTVTVSYRAPATDALQDGDGNKVASFTNVAVTNNTPQGPVPVSSNARVKGTKLTIDFNSALLGSSTPAPGAFDVEVGGTDRAVASGGVSVSGSRVTLTLSSAVTVTDVVDVDYIRPASNPLRSSTGSSNPLVKSFSLQDVENITPSRPTFDDGDSVTLLVAENHAAQAVMGQVRATDLNGDEVVYWLADVEPRTFHYTTFTIDGTGVIRKAPNESSLDYEAQQRDGVLKMVVHVSDGKDADGDAQTPSPFPPQTPQTLHIDDTIEVTVEATNVEEPPGAPTGVTLSAPPDDENSLSVSWTAPGDTGAVAIADHDVRYATGASDPADDSPLWTVVEDVGLVLPVSLTDLERASEYRVQVRAKGDGTGPWSASGSGWTGPITAPSFAGGATATFTIAENHAAGAEVGQVSAGDAEGDALRYSLVGAGADDESFAIDGAGRITVAAGVVLDYEVQSSYTVTARVSDGEDASGHPDAGAAVIDDTIAVTVEVENVAEPPGAPTAVTLSEPAASSLEVSWTAPVETGAGITEHDLRYYAGASDPADETQWVERSDVGAGPPVTLTGLEASTEYRVQVRVKGDGAGPWSASAGGTTSAPPAQPTAPVFDDGASKTLSVAESSAAGTAVGEVAANDADGDALTYSLTSAGTDHLSFAIGDGGVITVAPGAVLDYEVQSSYTVTARVSDGEDAAGNPETPPAIDATIVVTVTVTNVEEPPGAPTAVTLSAATASSLEVSWTAPSDTGSVAVGGHDLRYYAGASDPTDETQWVERSDVGSGSPVTLTGLEASTEYRVQVRAKGDGAGPWSASAGGTTSAPPATHSAPSFVDGAVKTLTIVEGSAAGTAVGQVPATDADGDALTYSLTSGGTDHLSFAIGGGGAITVASGAVLDAGVQSSYTVTARVSDGEDAAGNPETPPAIDATIVVTVTVTNVEEPPGAPTAVTLSAATASSLEVSWTAPSDTGSVAVGGHDLRYYAGASDPADETQWVERSDVGAGSPVTLTGLEASTEYRVQVRAKGDGAGPWSASAGGTTSAPPATHSAPSFVDGALKTLTIVEGSAAGTAVGQVAANDADGDALTYSLTSGGTDHLSFAIGGGGVITVASGAVLDAGVQSSYTVTARVSDGEDAAGNPETPPAIDATIVVTVTVTNVEEPPGAPTAVTLSAATASSLEVSWTAPSDTGSVAVGGHDLRYYAGASDPTDETQWVERSDVGSGSPVTLTGLEASTEYRVQVRAKGDGAGPWSASAGGTTSAPPATHSAPSFVDGAVKTLTIVEGSAAGTAVGQVPATDADGDALTYSLTSGGTDHLSFAIGGGGAITVASGAVLDAGVQSSYTVTARVSDGEDASGAAEATPTVDDTIVVTIDVTAAQENRAPVADAGAAQAVEPGERVTLDGTGSSDPDGDPLQYEWRQSAGVPVRLEDAGTARAVFVAPSAPGELSFTLAVTDGRVSGEATVTVTVAARDEVPGFGAATVDDLTVLLGEAMTPVELPEASGGNGALRYGLTSEPAGLAGLDFDPSTRRLSGTPEVAGSWRFAYRAEDADANRADTDAAELLFEVTVGHAVVVADAAVKQVLAAVGRRALSSALSNITARLGDALPGRSMTLAGRSLGLGNPSGGSCLAGGSRGDALGDVGLQGFGADGVADCSGMPGRSVGASELLRASAFSLDFSEGEGSDPLAPRWGVWGHGDFSDFAGRPEPGLRYEGRTRTGWLGVDARAGRWVAGVALSHGTSEAPYVLEDAGGSREGRLETVLTAVYPYGRWTFAEGLEVRGIAGAGTGDARHWLGGARETGGLSMRMASVGLRSDLGQLGGLDLSTRADASVVRIETGAGPESIDGLSADVWRGRLGLEALRRFALGDDGALTPFVEVAGRRDGGDGLTGSGLELAGGVRYGTRRFELEARGRVLATHTEAGARERGLSVNARLGAGAQGRGLWFTVSPRWGASTGAGEALWGDELPRLQPRVAGAGAGGLEARLGYGLGAGAGGVLTPFAEAGLAGGEGRRLRLGARFEVPRTNLGVELSGERDEGGGAVPDQAVRLAVGLRF